MNLNNMIMSAMMNRLQAQNPQAYNTLNNLMNSGQSPEQILNKMLASGQINQQQINQAKQMLNSYMNNPTQNTNNKFRF